MHSLLILFAGMLAGSALTVATLLVSDAAYVQRIPRSDTPDAVIDQWIERDNCRPVMIGSHVSFYRCPRVRL